MAKIIIKLENGAYNYYEDGKLVKSNLSVRKVIRKDKDGNVIATVGDIVLPQNPYGKNTISTTRFNETTTEYDLADATVRTSTKSGTKLKINVSEHYTEEEKAKVEKLQAQIDKINEGVKARIEKAQKEQELIENAMKLTPEQLKAILAKMEAKA